MAVRWMRLHPAIIPPMNFQELLAGIDLDDELIAALNVLLLAKSRSKEIGKAQRVEIIDAFIIEEFDWAREAVKSIKGNKSPLRAEADALFRTIIKSA